MIAGFRDPARALLFTLGGALLALLWIEVAPLAAFGAVVVVFLASMSVQKYGESLAVAHPKRALRLMETRLVSIGALTAATGALGIVIAVELATEATGYDKELATVVSGALVAFVTGVTYTADKVDAVVGKYIKGVFLAAYPRKGQQRDPSKHPKNAFEVEPGSMAERVLASSQALGLTDWSHDNRHERIDYLVDALKEGNA